MIGADLDTRFVAYLKSFAVGAEKAQTAVTICAALGLVPNEQSRRILRACCAEAIRSGVLVCSGQRGYFVPATPAEVLSATLRLKSDAGELWDRAKRMDQLAAERFELREVPVPMGDRPALFAMMEAE